MEIDAGKKASPSWWWVESISFNCNIIWQSSKGGVLSTTAFDRPPGKHFCHWGNSDCLWH